MRTRTPKPHKVGNRNQPPDTALGDPPPTAPYPIRRGGHATPDRSRMPDIGAACHDTRKVMPAPAFTDELREGVELGT